LVDFAVLQAAVKERLEMDSAIQSVETEGDTLEAAISEAATLLAVPLRYIEYEVVEKQTSFFGIGKNLCKIRANKRHDLVHKKDEFDNAEIVEEEIEMSELVEDNVDGEIYIQCRQDGVYMKVTIPEGEGIEADMDMAVRALKKRGITVFNTGIVDHLLKHPGVGYVRVADFQNIYTNDTTVKVEINDEETAVFITVKRPGHGGCDLAYENYIEILNGQGVIAGINEDFLRKFADEPVYRERICVASARKPVDGENSYVEYFFETDPGRVKLSETAEGRVNFKELNIIQNVLKDEMLAKLHPAQKGEAGVTVTGRSLPANEGKDIPVTLGRNVRFSPDGLTILADINGQVVMANGKINVEAVYTLDGSVDLKTGNILFLGNVVITGNVTEGFSVKASGNIEVYGMVDKASLTAEGDIIVRQGINGKKGEAISAGHSIWAKFIENTEVKSGDMVVVSDGILNSNIIAERRIICQGKRAAVIGGRLRASEEICAKSLGSPSGNTETICEVGFDPNRKARLDELMEKHDGFSEDIETININLKTLTNTKRQRGSLSDEKEKFLTELTENHKKISDEIAKLDEEIAEINCFLRDIKASGRVSASGQFYPGVVIKIRNFKYLVTTNYKASSFVLEDNIIRAVDYIEPAVNISQKTGK
jgi:uncharacterized protein (DUF342 family)